MRKRWIALLCTICAFGVLGCEEESSSHCASADPSGELTDPGSSEPEVSVETHYTPSQICDTHEKLCDGMCTDVTTVMNCGNCGVTCKGDEVCEDGACAPRCKQTVCGEACVDTTSNKYHCGGCGIACAANMACNDSKCACAKGYVDCDGDAVNGCETLWACSCTPGQTMKYWTGDEAQRNVGECREGILECQQIGEETDYVMISEEVLPHLSTSCTDKDYNCNGVADGKEDVDGDGFSICAGDCCDNEAQCKALNPELINPSMLEIADNKTDDNCNGQIDEPLLSESDVQLISYTYPSQDLDKTARAIAQAMGILWECAPESSCAYGLVNAKLTRASSTAPIDPRQVNIVDAMRNASGVAKVLPREGSTFAMLSSGEARDVKSGVGNGDLELEAIVSEKQVGKEMERVSEFSAIPAVYLTAHGGKLQTHEKCSTGTVKPSIFDSVQLHLEIKVPSNVKGIRFDFRFFSREYPEYVCSAFNDFFLAILSTGHSEMNEHPDHNIAFDKNGNPVSINNGFFTTCRKISCKKASDCPAFMACGNDGFCTAGDDTCQDGDGAIEAYYPEPYNNISGRGGGTAWLTTTAPVVGGEIISLDFYIWDTQDRKYDSTVLLDNFKWLLDETKVNTGFATEDPNDDPIIN
ncbi:MAG: choice-of-anchor L domain-containing protein [Proteobacteria bacterium]|nr:choice-of-anchor L domain-containing protein [Pseudomonadota bacterium]